MKTSSIIAITAASTLGVAALAGAAVAAAATESANDPQRQGQSSGPGDYGPDMGGPGDHSPGMGGPGDHGPGMRGHGGPMGDVLHGEMVVEQPDGAIVTVRMQEGTATAVSATSITIASTDGFTATYAITADTEQERDRTEGAAAKVGDSVHVRATAEGTTATADDIHALSPEAAQAMEEQRAAMEQWLSERPEPPAQGGRAQG